MSLEHIILILATFLCSLVAGFLFAFAVVGMPGIGKLRDREFLRAFQVMDRVIQERQPLFMAVWVGSAVALVAAAVLAFGSTDDVSRRLIVGALFAYLLGVQLPTVAVNIPLNNRLQKLDIEGMDDGSIEAARADFERRWNVSNAARTAMACVVSLTLMVVLTTI